MGLIDKIRSYLNPDSAQPLSHGVYHQRSGPGSGNQYRLHLRIEDNGGGILVVNASRILHVNQTAAEYASLLIQGYAADEVVKKIRRRYQVSQKQARADFEKIRDTIHTLTTDDDVCPITYLGVERIEPFDTPTSAPYRMDLALTYRCQNQCLHCYVGRERKIPEMETEAWFEVLERLWDIGIPHVCFTGGEATLRDDLPQLIERAEDIGIVTGLLTNGRRLGDRAYLDRLVTAGLDHVQITLESHDSGIHNQMVAADGWAETVDGIKNALDAGLYTVTNTTLSTLNADNITSTVDFLAELGVRTFACNGLIYTGDAPQSGIGIREADLPPILERIKASADQHDMRFIWYTPTRYHVCNPVDLELGVKRCTAAKYNMCLEPNGDVLPCQSYYQPLGNILSDSWQDIWNHTTATALRERDWVKDECRTCEDFALCGGGCPLYLEGGELHCVESQSAAV
jgi:radical SAM protein with 4Fe4S-binding SPASM domain